METESATDSELKGSFALELHHILQYWIKFTIDPLNGGFYGEVTEDNMPVPDAVKGAVLNARILWSFSAAYNLTGKQKYLLMAGRAYDYIRKYFIDPVYGGVYWSVTSNGLPCDTKKQVYAQAFTIYGLAAYYQASNINEALNLAKDLYYAIESRSYDSQNTGYFEAFSREWEPIDDLRLSQKDANEKKTANTHLHILEAYTLLYEVWPDRKLAEKLKTLVGNFEEHFFNGSDDHLILFFDENWYRKSATISYGHDIEAAWLLLKAAEALGDEKIIAGIQQLAIKIARRISEIQNADGSLNYEFEPGNNHLITERHWWVQAEAIVGFFNAWQLTGEEAFRNSAEKSWNFTRKQLIDHVNGEWHWGVYIDGALIPGFGKVGFWKCPYHNSRACIEMIGRLGQH